MVMCGRMRGGVLEGKWRAVVRLRKRVLGAYNPGLE